jgi:hypothetical protein
VLNERCRIDDFSLYQKPVVLDVRGTGKLWLPCSCEVIDESQATRIFQPPRESKFPCPPFDGIVNKTAYGTNGSAERDRQTFSAERDRQTFSGEAGRALSTEHPRAAQISAAENAEGRRGNARGGARENNRPVIASMSRVNVPSHGREIEKKAGSPIQLYVSPAPTMRQ